MIVTATKPTGSFFTIRCDDRRYCANGTFSITAADEENAYMAARGQGWEITLHGDTAICPACLNRQHPRRHP